MTTRILPGDKVTRRNRTEVYVVEYVDSSDGVAHVLGSGWGPAVGKNIHVDDLVKVPTTAAVKNHGVSKWQLFSSLVNHHPVRLENRERPLCGIVQSIESEDGSGSSFNIRFVGESETVYVRTID